MKKYFDIIKECLFNSITNADKSYNYSLIYLTIFRFGLCFYIVFSALGSAPRQIGSIIALIGIIFYYLFDYKNSNLKYLGNIKFIYFIFIGFLAFKSIHNIDISDGIYAFRLNIHEAFSLFFVALEFVRNDRDIKFLVILFCIAGFFQGLNGIYQYVTGADFVRDTPIVYWFGGMRLTGSMKTYRVGNYLSMVIPICLSAWFILPRAWRSVTKVMGMLCLVTPPMFLLIGSQTRSAFVGMFVALLALFFMFRGFSWKKIAASIAVLSWGLFFGFQRTSLEMIQQDGRIRELWPFALKVFQSAPILGVGLGGYTKGVHAAGLTFKMHSHSFPHPHNVYLQFLCEMGIVGLLLLLVFLASFLFWSLHHLLRFRRSHPANALSDLTPFFWASFLGYTATAISAHDFFRPWWLALAFTILGIVAGSVVTMQRQTPASNPPTQRIL